MSVPLQLSLSRRRLLRASAASSVGVLVAGTTLRCGGVATPERGDRSGDAQFASLETVIDAAMSRVGVPGAAVGIIHGEHEYERGFGIASRDRRDPVDAETLFQVGSLTKTYTATAVMRLIDRGALHLDVPVRAWLPELKLADPDVAANLTLRHIMTHAGGWFGDIDVLPDGDPFSFGDGDDAIARCVAFLHRAPQLAPLGSIYSYNNSAFVIAGRVLERVRRTTYEAAVRELVLTPLRMRRSSFFPAETPRYPFADGHIVNAVTNEPSIALPWAVARCMDPAGGLTSNVRELLRYARFHMGDGKPLLNSEPLTIMQMSHVRQGPPGPDEGAVGISWHIPPSIGGIRFLEHDGRTNGQVACIRIAPGQKFAAVVLTNADRGNILIDQVLTWCNQHLLGLPPPTGPALATSLSPDRLQTYVGRFEVPGVREIELRILGEVLLIRGRGKGLPPLLAEMSDLVPVEFVGEDRARTKGRLPFPEVSIDFLRDRAGQVLWARVGGRALARRD